MKLIQFGLIFLLLPLLPFPLTASPMAVTVLKKADQVRNPQVDYTVLTKVTDHKPKKKPKESLFKTMAKGREKAVILTLEPQIDRGRVLLMRGSDFWAFLPNVSRPLRISLQEKLTGEVANGDLARTNFSGDYTPSFKKQQKYQGRWCYVLQLKAKKEDVTYGKAILWVDKKNYRPLKADYFAFSGRHLKSCLFQGYKQIGGAVRPTKLILKDAVRKDQYSVLEFSEMVLKPLPEKYFMKNYMKRFQ